MDETCGHAPVNYLCTATLWEAGKWVTPQETNMSLKHLILPSPRLCLCYREERLHGSS